jgi:chromosome segregation ATPase
LEILIDEGGARLQQERHRSNQLEERVADLQWTTAQLESTIAQLSEDGEVLRQSLALERMKVQELQSRLITLLATNDTLSSLVSEEVSGMPHERRVDIYQLTLENLRLQELVRELQITHNKDQAALKGPEDPLQGPVSYPCDCSSSSSDGSSTVVGTTRICEVKSPGTSTQACSESVSQTSNYAGMGARSWYKE